ncbi:hypothetical protein O0I10_009588 [Lichtheimia ornata]|uniref:Uncharacterized protein n=1 Tax=Lichtheimia ornata TaxID=688661 RepID=A0AAD7XVM5_9FUNG|nr:uncharacterized protein O0I10_009588 [Lichtheimia ornata]KAJ8654698.1 hypothetical protein O0I10_009588 [Lichtheimia ornata]
MSNNTCSRINRLVSHFQHVKPTRKRNANPSLQCSPYAKMLASPLRQCKYHRKMFPSALLLRFGLGRDDKINKISAAPEIVNTSDQGTKYYVHLRKKVLQELQPNGFQPIFRGACQHFDKDMEQRVEQELGISAFQHLLSNRTVDLQHVKDREWQSEEPLQCILVWRHPSSSLPFCELDHRVGDQLVPSYDVRQLWPDKITSMIDADDTREIVATGVKRSSATVKLAMALWRCHQYYQHPSSESVLR